MDGETETPAKAGTEAKGKTETVTLKCQHTHGRKVYGPDEANGDRITVSKGQAAKLRRQDVCK